MISIRSINSPLLNGKNYVKTSFNDQAGLVGFVARNDQASAFEIHLLKEKRHLKSDRYDVDNIAFSPVGTGTAIYGKELLIRDSRVGDDFQVATELLDGNHVSYCDYIDSDQMVAILFEPSDPSKTLQVVRISLPNRVLLDKFEISHLKKDACVFPNAGDPWLVGYNEIGAHSEFEVVRLSDHQVLCQLNEIAHPKLLNNQFDALVTPDSTQAPQIVNMQTGEIRFQFPSSGNSLTTYRSTIDHRSERLIVFDTSNTPEVFATTYSFNDHRQLGHAILKLRDAMFVRNGTQLLACEYKDETTQLVVFTSDLQERLEVFPLPGQLAATHSNLLVRGDSKSPAGLIVPTLVD